MSDNPVGMDQTRTFLDDLIRERGVTRAAVSRAIGQNHAYVHQFLSAGKPRHLPERVRIRLGNFFNVDPDRFRDPDDDRTPRELDARLVRRVQLAMTILRISDPIAEAEVFATVYVLLERERAGHRITDDEPTLQLISELVKRLGSRVDE